MPRLRLRNTSLFIALVLLIVAGRTVAAAPYRVLFVRGFLSDQTSSLAGKTFRAHMDYFRQHGVLVSEADIQTGRHWSKQARQLAAQIESFTEPVIIVSHSLGGLTTLRTLLDYEAARARTIKWISIQAPFYGSPKAEAKLEIGAQGLESFVLPDQWQAFAQQSPLVKRVRRARNVLVFRTLWGGDWQVLEDLTRTKRTAIMERDHAAILDLSDTIDIVSITSHADSFIHYGSMFLPGSRELLFPGAGHQDIAVAGFRSARQQVTRLLETDVFPEVPSPAACDQAFSNKSSHSK